MPYSASDVSSLPENVQKMSPKARRQWVAVWSSAKARALAAGKSEKDAEASAFAQANGVANNTADHSVAPATFDWGASGAPPPPLYVDEQAGTVYRKGPVFEAGDYPDKQYAMTPQEITEAAEHFDKPVPVDLEHMANVLDPELTGRLGQVVHLEPSEDGQHLSGIVALPKWLDDQIGSVQRKVSASWNRATKRLDGLALVLQPRVEKAALMAAFAKAQEGSTKTGVFAHDPNVGGGVDRDKIPAEDFAGKDRSYPIVTASDVSDAAESIGRAGADNYDADTLKANIIRIAKRKGSSFVAELPEAWKSAKASAEVDIDQLRQIAEFATQRHDTPEGRGTLQLVHDIAARSGAVCKAPESAAMAQKWDPDNDGDDDSTPEGDTDHSHWSADGKQLKSVPGKPMQADMASRHEADALQQIHNMASDHGAQCASAGPAFTQQPQKEGGIVVGLKEFFARFADMPEERLNQLVAGESAATPPPAVANAADAAAAAAAAAATAAGAVPNPSAVASGARFAANPNETDTERRLRSALAASEQENRRIQAERIAEQAAFFADHFIKGEHKAFPAERDACMQAYIQAATDDLLLPGSVTFADGKPASRLAILKSTYDARPAHQLTAEQIAPGIFAALANRDTTTTDASQASQPVSAEQLRSLISRTTLGQAMLDHTDRNGVASQNGKS